MSDQLRQEESNISRAEQAVGRRADSPRIIKWFALCTLKSTGGTKWARFTDGLAMDNEPQTFVFVALEALGPENGFPYALGRGQDVCMDGTSQLLLPPTGGGLVMIIVLRI